MPGEKRKSSVEHHIDKQAKQENQGTLTHASQIIDPPPKDHWTTTAYTKSASFVPLLTQEILQWLDPQLTETILDLGCGDGVLTAQIIPRCRHVTGLDASENFIHAARDQAEKIVADTDFRSTFSVQDCRYVDLPERHYDKVFSNAALHWILRDPSTRLSVLKSVYSTLKPGGTFVFEMGGAGNVAEVHAALLAALVHQGISNEKARAACPWYFPSEQLMTTMLEEVGFRVEKSALSYRPTKLTTDEGGGLRGWVKLMGAQFLEILDAEEKREAVVREVCDVLETVLRHEEDDGMYLGYVRLRFVARK